MIFQYAQLLKGSIRLVRFHPDSTPANVSLTLEHEARYVDRNVHYTALAYEPPVSGGEMNEILLQGRTRRVPRTLWQALSAMVEHHNDSGRFWIDYVCINQNNENEQSDHKARLSGIYAAADEVLLWAGSGDTIAGADRESGRNSGAVNPSGNGTALRVSKEPTFAQSTLERLQLQKARKIVLLQGKNVRNFDPHSAL